MNTVTVTRTINADLAKVWALISDVGLIDTWHPGVRSADLLSDAPVGLGATRRCNFYTGASIVEEIVELREFEGFRLDLRDFNGPIKRFASEWKLAKVSDDKTQLTIEMQYEMKFGFLGEVMSAVLVKGRMTKLLNRVLAGLDHHAATGERIEQDFDDAVSSAPTPRSRAA